LLELKGARGLNDEKVRRLHGLAQAALDGRLDTEHLRAIPPEEALASLRELHGVGPFTADAVLYRGCGVADGLPASDDLGRTVVRDLYGLPDAGAADVERIAEAWRPFRMWAVVLLRMAWTRAQGGNVSYRRRC
jgi:DNA-3-methyladenine glycosylase II